MNQQGAPKIPSKKTLRIIQEHLSYDQNTGELTWVKSVNNRTKEGQEAGFLNHNGYRRVSINYTQLYTHQIAWFLTSGKWPTAQIDHINRVKTDNRIENLRLCTESENRANRTKFKGITSIFKGVDWQKNCKKYRARICVNKKQRALGHFDTAREAAEAYNMYVIENNLQDFYPLNDDLSIETI